MPLVGFTSDRYGDRVFSLDELLNELDSPDNQTNYTSAVVLAALAYKGTDPDAFTLTGLTGTCPREYQLRVSRDYTVNLESMDYAFRGANLRDMLARLGDDPGRHVARNRLYQKFFKQLSGTFVPLQATIDEMVTDPASGDVTIRIYKTTKTLPKPSKGPYPLHLQELAYYRYILSGHGNQPEYRGEFGGWLDAAPVNAPFGEVIYLSQEGTARMQVEIADPAVTARNLRLVLPLYLDGASMPSYEEAVDEDGLGYGWKCSFCPVFAHCRAAAIEQRISTAQSKSSDPYEI